MPCLQTRSSSVPGAPGRWARQPDDTRRGRSAWGAAADGEYAADRSGGRRYRLLGHTGLRVSELGLGAMVFGDQRGSWGARGVCSDRRALRAGRRKLQRHREQLRRRRQRVGCRRGDRLQPGPPGDRHQVHGHRPLGGPCAVGDRNMRLRAPNGMQLTLFTRRDSPSVSLPGLAPTSFRLPHRSDDRVLETTCR
jgi:hypothetical protein